LRRGYVSGHDLRDRAHGGGPRAPASAPHPGAGLRGAGSSSGAAAPAGGDRRHRADAVSAACGVPVCRPLPAGDGGLPPGPSRAVAGGRWRACRLSSVSRRYQGGALMRQPGTLDPLDIEIIRLLQKDGRLPYSAIAERFDIAEGTVRKRVTRLMSEGYFRIVGVASPFTVGMHVVAIIVLNVARLQMARSL